jgi:hypothetical protein
MDWRGTAGSVWARQAALSIYDRLADIGEAGSALDDLADVIVRGEVGL